MMELCSDAPCVNVQLFHLDCLSRGLHLISLPLAGFALPWRLSPPAYPDDSRHSRLTGVSLANCRSLRAAAVPCAPSLLRFKRDTQWKRSIEVFETAGDLRLVNSVDAGFVNAAAGKKRFVRNGWLWSLRRTQSIITAALFICTFLASFLVWQRFISFILAFNFLLSRIRHPVWRITIQMSPMLNSLVSMRAKVFYSLTAGNIDTQYMYVCVGRRTHESLNRLIRRLSVSVLCVQSLCTNETIPFYFLLCFENSFRRYFAYNAGRFSGR